MVLRVFFKLILYIINKILRISKVFLKKNFKIKLYDKNSALIVVFVLSPPKINNTIEKYAWKQNIFYLGNI